MESDEVLDQCRAVQVDHARTTGACPGDRTIVLCCGWDQWYSDFHAI